MGVGKGRAGRAKDRGGERLSLLPQAMIPGALETCPPQGLSNLPLGLKSQEVAHGPWKGAVQNFLESSLQKSQHVEERRSVAPLNLPPHPTHCSHSPPSYSSAGPRLQTVVVPKEDSLWISSELHNL